MTVRELRDLLTTAMQAPDDGETPVADLQVVLAIYDAHTEDVATGDTPPIDPRQTAYTYDPETFFLHATAKP